MSNAVFPSLPGIGITIKRSEIYATKVQTSASGKELRASFQASPRYSWEMRPNFLRQAGYQTVQDEVAQLGNFFTTVKGMWDSFLFTDPVDNTTAQQPIGTGDGSTTTFQLCDKLGVPIKDVNGSPSIYRTDWQGQQLLLYPNPRTNLCLFSEQMDNSTWSKVASGTGSLPVITANDTVDPRGGVTADTLIFNCGASSTISDESGISQGFTGLTSGAIYTFSMWLRGIAGTAVLVRGFGGTTYTKVTLTGTWQLVTWSETAIGTSGSISVELRRGIAEPINSSVTVQCWGVDVKLGGWSSYIGPTLNTPLTTTDYILSATGLVTIATAPLANAIISWSGAFYRRVRFNMDQLDLEQILNLCWSGGQLKMILVK